MNFFSGGQGSDALVEHTKIEVEAVTDGFNRMTEMCFKKCVVKYGEADLSVGEMTCIDRCTWKYHGMMVKLRDVIQQNEQQLMQQEAAKAQLNAASGGKK